jgi:hypothetical protein
MNARFAPQSIEGHHLAIKPALFALPLLKRFRQLNREDIKMIDP